MSAVPHLHAVAREPAQLQALPLPVLAAIAAQAAAEIATRMVTEPPAAADDDRLLTAEEAAPIVGLSSRYLRRNASRLPFTRRPSKGRVRFSERGIQLFIAKKRV